ncbi:MAG: helix-turn-helix domain-containing protein [Pseudonocardiaceae bacterium]
MSRPLTSEDRDQVRALHARGLSRNAIAREIGRSVGSVTKLAREQGLVFDRAATVAATAAAVADARARRAALMHALLDDAGRLREQLFAPCTLRNAGGKDNTWAVLEVEQPPFADQLKIVQATVTAADASMRLDRHDSGAGVEEAKSMLGALAEGLGVAYHQIKAAETADDG